MLHGAILIVTTGIFSLATLAFAQDGATKSQNAKAPANSASSSAPTSATAVASDPSASTDQKDAFASGTTAKPKKVWTNDDMGSLDHHSDVSVVGKRKPPQPTYHPNSYPRNGNTEYMVQYYRQQIDYMQQQADQIDKQISTLQDAKNGKTVDSQRTYNPWGGVQGDWNAQIAQLQKNKDNVLQQIDSLEEAIRKLDP
ncbi:MAG TPA: hypothetical protein VN885_02085 [Candidatus Acidoferrales bacterium]|nr:hypothetical protein [Candidatus Acidoferrales bacterium]